MTEFNRPEYEDIDRQPLVLLIPKNTGTLLDVGCNQGGFGLSLKKSMNIEVWGVPEFDTFLRKGLYLNDAHVQNCHYNAIFEGFGRLTVSNKSFCSGVRVVSPLADCLRWSVTW